MRNWEEQIENAVTAVLSANSALALVCPDVRRWADSSETESYPVALVHCSSAVPAKESESDEIVELLLNIGSRTHKRRSSDPRGATCRSVAGFCRDAVLASDFKTLVNALLTSLSVTSIDLLSGSDDGDFDNINQCNITLQIWAQTIATST
ncbi:MAG: hypothetical protein A2020_16390 [Lentisphaerae bacterium GWF2_45_14]|nr:MAG: hypothetical protein A2020_16390 [Lentisphaerae bacterium GWF2_45_14]